MNVFDIFLIVTIFAVLAVLVAGIKREAKEDSAHQGKDYYKYRFGIGSNGSKSTSKQDIQDTTDDR